MTVHAELLPETQENVSRRRKSGKPIASPTIDLMKRIVGLIEKQFGSGAIMTLGDTTGSTDSDGVGGKLETISTGSRFLDRALGVGGLPCGRLVEIFGAESSGKTTLALHAIAEVQKRGGTCAFIDAEHALDPTYAGKLGVNLDELLVSQPDHGEQALEIADQLVRSGEIKLIVIDSVAALVPRAELEGEMGGIHVGLQARMMSQAMRKLTGACHRFGTILLFINQTRQKIGVTYGSDITTTGGNALKFYASVRMDIRKIGTIKNGEEIIGTRTKVKIVKNKLAAPFREVEFDIVYGKGIDRSAEIIDLALEYELLVKNGAWFTYNGKPIAQGRQAVCRWLEEQAEVSTELTQEIDRRNAA